MNPILSATVLVLLTTLPPEERLRLAEEAMAQRPAEAVALAAPVAETLRGRADLLRQLWNSATRLQEQRLFDLEPTQVQELADIHALKLGDTVAAGRVRRRWLQDRVEALKTGAGPQRFELARLWLSWLGDRNGAMQLARQALGEAPQAVADLLRPDDLELLGPPRTVTRQVLYRRIIEQRFYNDPVPLLLELNCEKGIEPVLQTVRLPGT